MNVPSIERDSRMYAVVHIHEYQQNYHRISHHNTPCMCHIISFNNIHFEQLTAVAAAAASIAFVLLVQATIFYYHLYY